MPTQITVTTGFGYLKDASNEPTDKCILPIGDHSIDDGYTYVEVATQAELDAVFEPTLLEARDERMAYVRDKRKQKLFDSDWTQLVDAPLTAGQVTDYQAYRQTLRDLTVTAQTELDALMTITDIEAYEPAWPVDPHGKL